MTAQKLAVARTLYDSGAYTVPQIAGTLAVSTATVYRYLAANRPEGTPPASRRRDR